MEISRTFQAVMAGAATLVPTTGAWAEVCDKVMGDTWMPAHGPQLLLGFGMGASAILLIGLGVVIALRVAPAIVVFGVGLVVAAFAGVSLLEHYGLENGSVLRGTLREGCRALWADALGLVFGLLFIAAALIQRRRTNTWVGLG